MSPKKNTPFGALLGTWEKKRGKKLLLYQGQMSDLEQFSHLRLKQKRWVQKNVDDSDLLAEDKQTVEEIVCDILLFDPTVPEMKITIRRLGSCYNCLFKGWKSPIGISNFYLRFLDKESRDHKYDCILSNAEVTPEQDGEGGPFLVVRIQTHALLGTDKKRR